MKRYLSPQRKLAKPFLSLAILGLLALSSGCAALKPAQNESQYYLLSARAPNAQATSHPSARASCVVRLCPVEMADYLKTEDMVVRMANNAVRFEPFQRWAEPLASGIRRVVAENLRRAPEIRSVLTDQPAPAHTPVYSIQIHVLACNGTQAKHHGSANFEAVWQITRNDQTQTVLAHGVFRAPSTRWQPGDYSQLAGQLSQDLGKLGDVLVDAISRTTASPSGK